MGPSPRARSTARAAASREPRPKARARSQADCPEEQDEGPHHDRLPETDLLERHGEGEDHHGVFREGSDRLGISGPGPLERSPDKPLHEVPGPESDADDDRRDHDVDHEGHQFVPEPGQPVKPDHLEGLDDGKDQDERPDYQPGKIGGRPRPRRLDATRPSRAGS